MNDPICPHCGQPLDITVFSRTILQGLKATKETTLIIKAFTDQPSLAPPSSPSVPGPRTGPEGEPPPA